MSSQSAKRKSGAVDTHVKQDMHGILHELDLDPAELRRCLNFSHLVLDALVHFLIELSRLLVVGVSIVVLAGGAEAGGRSASLAEVVGKTIIAAKLTKR